MMVLKYCIRRHFKQETNKCVFLNIFFLSFLYKIYLSIDEQVLGFYSSYKNKKNFDKRNKKAKLFIKINF
jgi:hypothetical protein